jgi:hypothetical protein
MDRQMARVAPLGQPGTQPRGEILTLHNDLT